MFGNEKYTFTDDIFPIYIINVVSKKLHHARDFSGNFLLNLFTKGNVEELLNDFQMKILFFY
jgi:hypothetical protein